jgi:hypothetical protein
VVELVRAPAGQADFEEAVRLLTENAAMWSSLLSHSVSLDEIRAGVHPGQRQEPRSSEDFGDDGLTNK